MIASSRARRALLWSVLFAAAGYLAFSLWGGWADVTAALAHVSLPLFGGLLLLSLLNYALRFLRWHHYLNLFGHRVAARTDLRIYLGGFALTTTPGKAGEALRSVLLQPHGVPVPHSLAALLAERIGDMLAVLLLAAGGLAVYPQGRPVLMVLAMGTFAGLFIVQRRAWLDALDRWLTTRCHGRIARLFAGLIDTVLHSATLFTAPRLIASITLGVVAWGAEGIAFYLLAQALGAELSLSTALFIYAFAMLVGAVSFLPGGLGGAELTMVTLLALEGTPHGAAVAATVLIRLTTLWFAVVLGLGALLPGRCRGSV